MKRKNIILLALFLVMSTQVWAQSHSIEASPIRHSKAASPYKPLATFNGDTVAYLEFNYTVRNVQYKGWTVSEILQELEFPVLFIVDFVRLSGGGVPTTVSALDLCIHQTGKIPDPMKDYYITVSFENPPTLDRFREAAGGGNHPAFTSKLYNFIKDLKVSSVRSSEFILKDPEVIENRIRMVEENRRRGREGQAEWERVRRQNNQ